MEHGKHKMKGGKMMSDKEMTGMMKKKYPDKAKPASRRSGRKK